MLPPPRPIVAGLVFLLDLLGAAVALIVLVTTVAGPWTVTVGGQLLRVRSTGNLIVGLPAGRRAARARAGAPTPRRTRLVPCPQSGGPPSAWLAALSRRLDAVDARTALRVVGILIVVATAIRVANVFTHFGFLTGDDVEIHEMTLGVALGKAWPVWDLRNAFYPMTFIFPVQRALVALGVTDVFSLVAAGRLVVTAIAGLNVWILYRVGLSLYGDRGTALIAAALLAVNHLHMAYGSAELPRIVATAFLVPAFGALRTPTPIRCGLAGVLLGLGASLRFGEIVFAVPAVLSVLFGSRDDETGAAWRVRVTRAAAVLAGVAATVLVDHRRIGRAVLGPALPQPVRDRRLHAGTAPVITWLRAAVVLPDTPQRVERRAAGRAGLPGVAAGEPIGRCSGPPCRWCCSACCRTRKRATRFATIPFWALAAAPTLRSWIARGEVRTPHPGTFASARWDRAPRRGGRRLRRRQVPLRPLGSGRAPRLGHGAIASDRDRGRAALAIWRAPVPDASTPLLDLDLQEPDAERVLRDAVCRPDVHWAALRLRPLTADTTAVLSDCGLARELTERTLATSCSANSLTEPPRLLPGGGERFAKRSCYVRLGAYQRHGPACTCSLS